MRGLIVLAMFSGGPALAADVEHGQAVYQKSCANCHVLAETKNGNGPHLVGIIGRKVAGAEGYSYSVALKSAEGVWTAVALDPYLAAPGSVYKGTKMLNRLASETDRADVIAYLESIRP
jgi:cytochrome c